MNLAPNNIIQMIKTGANPQQVMLSYLENYTNTPMGANLLNLARSNNTVEIEKIARNLLAQQGRDFDTEFRAFRQNYRL